MKTINKYLFLAMAGSMLTFAACSDDIERDPSPIVDPDCQGAYFANETYDFELEPESPTSITLTVARTNTEAAATIGIEVLTNAENIFEVPESVSFEAGQEVANITLNFPNAEVGSSYSYELKLEEGSYNPYADQTLYAAGDVIRIKWNEFETAIYTDGILSGLYPVPYPISWYIDAEYAEFPDGSMRVRLNNPFHAATSTTPDANGIYDGFTELEPENIVSPNFQLVLTTDVNKTEATWPLSYLGYYYDASYGQVIAGTAKGLIGNDYPLGVVDYDAEKKVLNSIIFEAKSLIISEEVPFNAEGSVWIASNPTTLFFSLDGWKKYQEENAAEE